MCTTYAKKLCRYKQSVTFFGVLKFVKLIAQPLPGEGVFNNPRVNTPFDKNRLESKHVFKPEKRIHPHHTRPDFSPAVHYMPVHYRGNCQVSFFSLTDLQSIYVGYIQFEAANS